MISTVDLITKYSKIIKQHIFWIITFLLLTLFFWLTPLVLDDYTFYATLRSVHDLPSLINVNVYMYDQVNGRILGNFLSLVLAHNREVSSAMRAAILIGIIILACKLMDCRTKTSRNILVFLILFIPIGMFAQTYAWRAGFYNYVTPVLALFAIVTLISNTRDTFFKKPQLLNLSAIAILGFLGCLFAENITLGLLLLSISYTLWKTYNDKRLTIRGLVWVVASIAGNAAMFSSPVYSRIQKGGDNYREIGTGLSSYIDAAHDNIITFSNSIIVNNTILYILLAASTCILVAHKILLQKNNTKKFPAKEGMLLLLISSTVYFFIAKFINIRHMTYSPLESFMLWVEVGTVGVFLIVPLIVMIKYVDNRKVSNMIAGIYVSGIVFSAPLLFVHPISPRVFYATYILLTIATFGLGRYSFLAITRKKITEGLASSAALISTSLLIVLAVTYIGIFTFVRKHEIHNENIAYEQLDKGSKHISLEKYPFSKFTHPKKHNPLRSELYLSGKACVYRQCNSPIDLSVVFR